MTMTETPVAAPKKAKKRKAPKKAKPAAQESAFAGITPSDCPNACVAKRCAISGNGICAHPYKGGLQASMQTPDAMRRLNEAKRAIGRRKLNIAAQMDAE